MFLNNIDMKVLTLPNKLFPMHNFFKNTILLEKITMHTIIDLLFNHI